jgi:hypothetical protein
MGFGNLSNESIESGVHAISDLLRSGSGAVL